jgi:hypothetical protein
MAAPQRIAVQHPYSLSAWLRGVDYVPFSSSNLSLTNTPAATAPVSIFGQKTSLQKQSRTLLYHTIYESWWMSTTTSTCRIS